MPQRQHVVSSNIPSLGYDLATEILDVEFLNGGLYRVSGVSSDRYERLIGTASLGRAYNEQIRKAGLHAVKVEEAECPDCGVVGVRGDTCSDCGCSVYGGRDASRVRGT